MNPFSRETSLQSHLAAIFYLNKFMFLRISAWRGKKYTPMTICTYERYQCDIIMESITAAIIQKCLHLFHREHYMCNGVKSCTSCESTCTLYGPYISKVAMMMRMRVGADLN